MIFIAPVILIFYSCALIYNTYDLIYPGRAKVNNKSLIIVFFILLLPAMSHAAVKAKEALLFQDIPRVSTASRQVLTVLESPATATIITREDIVHSGYNSISRLLRYVAGIDFFQTSDSTFSVGMRGVNGLHANNVLILVDGRPLYSPVRNTNQCALIPEVPDDIERIEVVRGPGSVLYGSNAFSGVVNIITRSPEALPGVQLTGSGGTFSDYLYSFTSGKRFGSWSYKLLSAWTQKNSTQEHDRQIKGLWKMSGEMNYEKRPGTNYNVSFGFSKGKLLVVSYTPAPFEQDGFDGFLRTRFNRNDLKLDLWWRHFDTTGDVAGSGHLKWKFDHVDLLLQNKFVWGRHNLIGGAEGRFSSLGVTTYDGWHNQFIGSLFCEDRWKLSSSIDVFTGLRIDYQTEAHEALSPRISAVYSLDEDQSIRFSASRAFNYPSYLQNYIHIGTSHMHHEGNQRLNPEKLTSIELAYQRFRPSGLSFSGSVFYNYYNDIIDLKYRNEDSDLYLVYENLYDIYLYGMELSFQYRFALNLLLRGNYSYVWRQKKSGMIFGPVPSNQINGEVRYEFPRGFWIDMRFHWQDRSDYSSGIIPVGFPGSLPVSASSGDLSEPPSCSDTDWRELEGFSLADLSAGFISPDGRWSFTTAIHNLFHSTHREIPGGAEADTTFTARLSVSF